MRPTIGDQLDGALRLLDTLVQADELSAGSLDCIANIRRLLKHVGRSWAALPSFYAQDNDDLIEILTRASGSLPDALAERVSSAAALDNPAPTDVVGSSMRNTELRGLLSAALNDLPTGSDGDALRSQIGAYLRRRVEIDPA